MRTNWFANAAGLERVGPSLNNWGAAIVGPLRRDPTFFFVNYEAMRLEEPYTWRSAVPSIASRQAAPSFLQPPLNAFPIPNGVYLGGGLSEFVANAAQPARLDLGNIRLDHALTSRISVFGRYQKAPSSAESGFSQVDYSNFDHDSLTLGTTVLASPNVTSDFRFNVTRRGIELGCYGRGRRGSGGPQFVLPATPHARRRALRFRDRRCGAALAREDGSQQGNLGRNAIAGFGLGQVDLALGREFAVREESTIELRLEAFNAANHPRFADPVWYLNSPLFGQSASTLNLMLGSGTPHSGIAPAFQVGAPRILQITARFRW